MNQDLWLAQEGAVHDYLKAAEAYAGMNAQQLKDVVYAKTGKAVAVGGDLEDYLPPILVKQGPVAVLDLKGMLVPGAAGFMRFFGVLGHDDIKQAWASALMDTNVKVVLPYIRSPGGTVIGTHELAEFVKAVSARKPTMAYVELAASAAQWMVSGIKDITVNMAGSMGSIGVAMVKRNIVQALKMEGIAYEIIRSGDAKMRGGPTEELRDADRARLQQEVNMLANIFKTELVANYGIDRNTLELQAGDGRVLMAHEAVQLKLASRVGTYQDVLEKAMKKAAM